MIVLIGMRWRGYFEAVFTSEELGVKKPSLEIFRHALDHFSVLPSDGIHIGDSYEDDYTGAKSAQLDSILITAEPHADVLHQVSSILKIERFLR